jgi:hypothetical protein
MTCCTTTGSVVHMDSHTDSPTVEQHTSQTEKVQGKYTPALASPVNCNDEHGNEASVHELMHNEFLAPSPLMNKVGAHLRPHKYI